MSSSRGALFREIHKNSWLKRLTTDGKKITIGPKKSDRSWVVFCVHDDTEALLEGYAEPRLAPSHNPEWVVSMQDTQHISHALIPNSHEFEFVVTLSNEVVRFHAMSWEVMQEWVETLRSKLREMKIISPRENLYTKLPEVRAPLLPTRDPTSPLPATPPVPAAIVPGVERVVPSISSSSTSVSTTTASVVIATTSSSSSNVAAAPSTSTTTSLQDIPRNSTTSSATSSTSTITNTSNVSVVVPSTSACLTSMSNTLTQNLLNMLSDPISNYSEQLNTGNYSGGTSADDDEEDFSDLSEEFVMCLARPKLIPHTKIAHATLSPKSSLNDSSNRSSSSELQNTITDALSVRLDISSSANKENDRKSMSPGRQVVRPQTSRSLSISETTPEITTINNNITEFDVEKDLDDHPPTDKSLLESSSTNITIIQVSNPLPSSNKGPEIFKFPDPLNNHDEEYKSNVQIIPSNLSTIPIHTKAAIANQYSSPARASTTTTVAATSVKKLIPAPSSHLENHTITTVRVTAGSSTSTSNAYGSVCPSSSSSQTPKLSKKIILTTNTSGVTNIAVNNDVQQKTAHYEKVFLTSTVPISTPILCENLNVSQLAASINSPKMSRVKNTASQSGIPPPSATSSPIHSAGLKKKPIITAESNRMSIATQTTSSTTGVSSNGGGQQPSTSTASPLHVTRNPKSSPAMHRKRLLQDGRENCPPSALANRPFLTRGLTEAVITARPSRKDMNRPSHLKGNQLSNNNGEAHSAVERTRSESLEQRRRSSSTSDAPSPRPRTNNNEPRASTRMQQPPQPFRLAHENALNAQSSKRMTLREQQVLQLRREIMHPGGVRLQLRRKDCIGSIAWVDAFGAVWVAGWKQKEHPVLYNALHIGDQLISIAGITISSASEANKVIRNTNTLFLEVLIRRVPFGRGYAIRRERDGQCLGLIRDGNTSTIVDVVPNSLAARHGLPPKTQSCDGTTLTFWVLTEINGRPLNLFFKENEIRDRLNCIGRDISILVQPSDLITKLKKQLKSLRSHKDYIVQ
ncbi:uncharacterized protein LOC129914227 [Episyrphus balteatus]|uniref:uncharacterized protein LOC129914227 n=1 Tax=Episyrphus balteatus TaxID=286459 RepID=UPI0024867B8D|nr:uncharacterized protein LOC129914227 [Episyrphus balteatus]